jgi:hypothetical protein
VKLHKFDPTRLHVFQRAFRPQAPNQGLPDLPRDAAVLSMPQRDSQMAYAFEAVLLSDPAQQRLWLAVRLTAPPNLRNPRQRIV